MRLDNAIDYRLNTNNYSNNKNNNTNTSKATLHILCVFLFSLPFPLASIYLVLRARFFNWVRDASGVAFSKKKGKTRKKG